MKKNDSFNFLFLFLCLLLLGFVYLNNKRHELSFQVNQKSVQEQTTTNGVKVR